MTRARVLFMFCAACVTAAACRSVASTGDELGAGAIDAGASAEMTALQPKLEKLRGDLFEQLRRTDELLWAHWVSGGPLDLSWPADAGAALALTTDHLAVVRRARELKMADDRSLRHLELLILGELLARGTADENAEVSNLEASLSCTVDGREQRLRELSRWLVNEPSAVKRRALWASCATAASQLESATMKRDTKVKAVLASLDVPSALDFAADSRELDLDALAKVAERLLEQTEDVWRLTLKNLSEADLKLPPEALTRADVPRLMKVPASVDVLFSKQQVAPRALQTLGTLSLYGLPGLTLDLAETAKKNPLPLTVAPKPGDVRVSFRPLGGLRDQTLLFTELGNALALVSSKTGRFETTRLGDPAITQLSGALFATLTSEDAWLEEMGLAPNDRLATRAAWQAQHLFSLRRAAAVVLIKLEEPTPRGPNDPPSPRSLSLMSRALGVKLTSADAVRVRLESDEFLRSATLLRASLLAMALKAQLGAAWWRTPAAGQALSTLWSHGTSLPAETLVGSLQQGLAATLVHCGARVETVHDGGIVLPFLEPQRMADAGVRDGG